MNSDPNSGFSRRRKTADKALRDAFAGRAMAALIQTPFEDWPAFSRATSQNRSVSDAAYEIADAMLAVRNRR